MTKEIRFQSIRQTAEARAETTKRVAKEIVQTEADARNAKTQRLKAARLDMLARETEAAKTGPKADNHGKSAASED
ncbi:hypothetical protein [Roseibium aggregatum]|uniref:Uncharacterized protein n=1 Tax=Roseibium aggregatum TaxID=187304 RepID=A0A926P3G8_9HYPH|nr:hypothetical protein [Roseibium aggregatum]MBD1545942.1 hypothetical protein [Roseibium aggregatum]